MQSPRAKVMEISLVAAAVSRWRRLAVATNVSRVPMSALTRIRCRSTTTRNRLDMQGLNSTKVLDSNPTATLEWLSTTDVILGWHRCKRASHCDGVWGIPR